MFMEKIIFLKNILQKSKVYIILDQIFSILGPILQCIVVDRLTLIRHF